MDDTCRMESELAEIQEQMQFNGKGMGRILSKERILKMKLAKAEDQIRNLQQQSRRLQQRDSVDKLRKNEQILEAQIQEKARLQVALRESASKLAVADEETQDLKRKVADIQSKFEKISEDRLKLLSERIHLKGILKKYEKAVDDRVIQFSNIASSEHEEVCVCAHYEHFEPFFIV